MKVANVRSNNLMMCGALGVGLVAVSAMGMMNRPRSQVVTYPAPAGEAVIGDYRVEVNGKPVDIYAAKSQYFDKKYYFASFDFKGPITVRVTSTQSLERAILLPARFGIKPVVEKPNSLMFETRQPFRIAIERDGRNSPLLLFGNPVELDPPKPGDTNVVYFGPGIHNPVKIPLKDNQTLYLAGGAVVKGFVSAKGTNITVKGRGILDGNDYPHLKGPSGYMMNMTSCNNLVVRDITLRGAWTWALVPNGCDGVLIDNVKICGTRVLNDDGIDLVNSRDVNVRNCFIRTQDDCIAVKGLNGFNRKPCEKMTIETCEFWTDVANIFRVGYECDTAVMQDLTARDIDVLHYSIHYRAPMEFWCNTIFFLQPSDNMIIRRIRFENIRIFSDGSDTVLALVKPMVCGAGGKKYTEAGSLVDCVFKNISVSGTKGVFSGGICVVGRDDKHTVEDVVLDEVTLFGKAVSDESPAVTVGAHTRNIRFVVR